MITKYFTKVLVRFNPAGAEAKTARLFLSAIPPTQRNTTTKIVNDLILNSEAKNNAKKPLIKVTFKDKQEFEYDPTVVNIGELAQVLDRHSRKLLVKEAIEKQ
ncbi:39S ribosomal protein L44, mitochondrial [Hanseniaspora osmophila]|uniref:Large ribosomal subunit protein mL53 n=1 Tax=Hanseniaspora osmophila TaxID=56408 RepID=A0A1E5RAL3_9ASCO|nr:54S ribosomal protein L44, mitochondrial [Hanseniaspora osmophila]